MSNFTTLSLSALLVVMWQTPVSALAGDTAGMAAAPGSSVSDDRQGGASERHEPECE